MFDALNFKSVEYSDVLLHSTMANDIANTNLDLFAFTELCSCRHNKLLYALVSCVTTIIFSLVYLKYFVIQIFIIH